MGALLGRVGPDPLRAARPRPTTSRRVAGTAFGVALLVLAAGLIGAPPAQASAYRYWTYWQTADGAAWTFGAQGPATTIPADGAVEGWRFAVSSVAGGPADQPRVDPATAFATVCASTPSAAGRKRVAVVIDPGTVAEAPEGQQPPPPRAACISAEPDATGYAVLRAAATTRVERGLICAVDDYPTGECAVVVADDQVPTDDASPGPITLGASAESPAAAAPAPSDSGGTALGVVGALALLLALAIGAWALARRRTP